MTQRIYSLCARLHLSILQDTTPTETHKSLFLGSCDQAVLYELYISGAIPSGYDQGLRALGDLV